MTKKALGSLGGQEACPASPATRSRVSAARPARCPDHPGASRSQAQADAAGARVLPPVPPGPGSAARGFPTWFPGMRRAARRGQRVGPAAGLLRQELGAQAHCPPEGRLRGMEWGPWGPQALSRHFPAERNQALLIKTNKQTNPKQATGCDDVARQRSPAGSVGVLFFMNWQHVYVDILINRENRSPISIIWGPPRLLEGVRKKMRWKAIYFAGVGG